MNKQNNQHDNSENLIDALDKADGLQAISEIAEAILDSKMTDGFLKEIPIIGSAIALVKAGVSVRDYLFLRKILLFMSGCRSVDEKFRIEFIEKCTSDQKYSRQIGEHIINALDKFDQISKAEAFAKIFVAFLEHKISFGEYQRYTYALDKIDFNNIDVLVKFYQEKLSTKSKPFLQNFAFVGLVSISVQSDTDPRENSKFSTSYHQEIKEFNRNSFGEKFLWILKIEGFNISRNAIYQENETFEFGTGSGRININYNPPC